MTAIHIDPYNQTVEKVEFTDVDFFECFKEGRPKIALWLEGGDCLHTDFDAVEGKGFSLGEDEFMGHGWIINGHYRDYEPNISSTVSEIKDKIEFLDSVKKKEVVEE